MDTSRKQTAGQPGSSGGLPVGAPVRVAPVTSAAPGGGLGTGAAPQGDRVSQALSAARDLLPCGFGRIQEGENVPDHAA